MDGYLILGLGNPGAKYKFTRHNVGWMVAERIIEKNQLTIFEKTKYYEIAEYKHKGKTNIVGVPLTYMNLSGEATIRLASKYNIPIENILVLVDEYNFPLGKIHLKKGGGDGGHNGIGSIIEKLNNNNFLRMRLGIDRNFGQGELVDYVLSEFRAEEADKLSEMLDNSIKGINYLIENGFARAASEINSGKLFLPFP